ncbi:hypothetical protein Bca4012_065060 [Brassica carinata]
MPVPRSMFACCVLDGKIIVAGGFTTSRRSISIRRKLHLYIDMAITNMQLSGLKARRCKETVVTQLLRLWAARTVKKGGELMGVGLVNYECGTLSLSPSFVSQCNILKVKTDYKSAFTDIRFSLLKTGSCVAFVDAEKAEEAASYVKDEYEKAQPEFAKKLSGGKPVLNCEAGDSAARVL